MPGLAFFTYGTLHHEHAHTSDASFQKYAELIYRHAEQQPGFIWANYAVFDAYPSWKSSEGWTGAQTLTLWTDLESVFRFSYEGVHAEALKRRKQWFGTHDRPIYVAWWVEDGSRPNWRDGVERIEYLDAHGPTVEAFSFKVPFTPTGEPAPPPTLRSSSRQTEARGRMAEGT